MGYTGTTNYGFQKPAKENAFTVDDLNNALDKIDETIKDESIKSVSLDTDENDNLILKIIKNNNQDYTDQVSLAAISGSLVVNATMATANMTITKTATNQQIYNGVVTSQTIPTGAGSFKVKITQFGSTIEKDVQVSGETLLDLTNDIVTVTPKSSAISWSINGTSIPSVNAIKVIKGITKNVKMIFGNWKDGTEIYWEARQTFNSNMSISPSYSLPKFITTSGSFVIPKTAQYEIVISGGGGGGGGGSIGEDSYEGGGGGNGGNGGFVRAVRVNYTENQSIPVTIGIGGNGGSGEIENGASPTQGSKGGTTIFGSYQAVGGTGGTVQNKHYGTFAYGGNGGAGSDNQNMDIFGSSIKGGTGGNGQSSNNSSPGTGTSPNTGIDWLSNVGKGGNGGEGGQASNSHAGGTGGYGGYGFNTYGVGGTGGRGAHKYVRGSKRKGSAGRKGNSGAIAIRVAV